jgi:hypothetical protein
MKKRGTVPKMTCKKIDGKWWITGVPGMEPPGCGPYDTRDEAEGDRRGLERFDVGTGAPDRVDSRRGK